MSVEARRTCAVIGAGMTGLVAADELQQAGLAVTVFEKSAAQGGRIATRHTPVALFNHGAPAIEGSDPEFVFFLKELGAVTDEDGCFRKTPSMRSLFDGMTRRLRVRWRIEVLGIEQGATGWNILSAAGGRHGPFDAVVVTVPAPQAARVIDGSKPAMSERLASVEMEQIGRAHV